MAHIPIWPGSSSFFPGDTPFGYYDGDYNFQQDADTIADWCARRLGYPIVDVELQQSNFFAAFEEAISEYGNQVNTYVSRDNLLNLLGVSTGSQSLTQEYISPSNNSLFKLAEHYGTDVGVNGKVTYFTGSIQIKKDKQTYDLTKDQSVFLESGSFQTDSFTIRRVHHYSIPALIRYQDPYAGTGLGMQGLLEGFEWGGYTPAVSFVLYPLNHDLLRIQGIEFNDMIRKSAYSFELINNRLKIFPIPSRDVRLHFEYTLDKLETNPLKAGRGKISDYSNVPYGNMIYSRINSMGKQWIKRYTLALCKEMLGYVRSKYSSIPIPESEITLNGDALLSAAETEKQNLLEELKEILNEFSRQSILERKQAESDALQSEMNRIPLKFYIG
jgi:hypothetical protein